MYDSSLWEIDKAMADEETRALWRKQRAKWVANNHEREREINNKAAKRYHDRRMAEDPEKYIEERRIVRRKSDKKYRENKFAAMTPEELEAFREKQRIRLREYRAKKKAEKLAQQQALASKEKGQD